MEQKINKKKFKNIQSRWQNASCRSFKFLIVLCLRYNSIVLYIVAAVKRCYYDLLYSNRIHPGFGVMMDNRGLGRLVLGMWVEDLSGRVVMVRGFSPGVLVWGLYQRLLVVVVSCSQGVWVGVGVESGVVVTDLAGRCLCGLLSHHAQDLLQLLNLTGNLGGLIHRRSTLLLSLHLAQVGGQLERDDIAAVVADHHHGVGGVEVNVRQLGLLFLCHHLLTQRLVLVDVEVVHKCLAIRCDSSKNCGGVRGPGNVAY